ncbi:MAG TPA: DEAD/DEAH box helicase [Candidatus Gracilibacteria bacterium]|nr:DEAD/DEAH box helicase [Candidatus Gracilibacteria bacterium]
MPVAFKEAPAPYVPQIQFNDFEISEKLKQNIIAKGYKTPTPIQDKSINYILSGLDIVGIANTGTGKTAAFLIPLINKVMLNRQERVLIVVPTRELALQIQEELFGFTKMLSIYSVLCIGGANIGPQIAGLKRQCNFVIGTPGRLKDLISRRILNLSQFKNIVLDEADRMLDMGFIHDIRFLVSHMPKERQSLFFSATISPEIQSLIKDFLDQPITVSVKSGETAVNVEQDVIRVTRDKKMDVLHDLLIKQEFQKVLIFGRTKHGVEKLSVSLAKRGFSVDSIHGNKSQYKRQKTLNMFKTNKLQILVATDVAARGLDIESVSHVINYDLPATYDDYVHRIGRTGRADKKGKALTFIE